MKKLTILFIAFILLAAFNQKKPEENPKELKGYLYTTTNGEGINQVLKIDRYSDGSLFKEVAFSTQSKGGANTMAGGDAKGDFDSQNAVQIIGDYLLNVNAGGNTISVFAIEKSTGNLTLKKNVPSGGERPVSIAFTKKDGNNNAYWVVVGNQWNNPNVQKDGANIERYPNDAFHNSDLEQVHESDAARNITLFSFNASNGELTRELLLDTYVRKNGGPTCVSFSDDGKKLAVSTWGIAHFGTEVTSLEEQHPSRVYVYDFNDGILSGERYFEEEGIAGSIGFNWAKGSNTRLHVSNFNLIPSKRNYSLTVLKDTGTRVLRTANFNTAGTGDIDEACWTVLNPKGDKLYVASFGANVISSFKVDRRGNIVSSIGTAARGDNAPAGDTKDMYITADNKHLYTLGAFQSFSISRFDIDASGKIMYKEQFIPPTTKGSIGKAGAYNFLGLAGYDIK
jgi:6-phosphogluconolactonase (cycloisomerase 2 family)